MRYDFSATPEPFEFDTEFGESESDFGEFEAFDARVPGRVLTYTTKDVIDQRIGIPAQHALVRLSRNPATSAAAVGMLADIKAGRLGGLFCVNWKIPAQRAIRLGTSWWTAIPTGEDAILMLDPNDLLSGPPLIAFARELDPDCGLRAGEKRFAASPSRLDTALMKLWPVYRQWRAGRFAHCNERSGLPLRNVVPAGFCQTIAPPPVRHCPSPPTASRQFTTWIQQSLNRALGLGLVVDGNFNVPTRSALRNFQRRSGLVPSGAVDPSTANALHQQSGLALPCQLGRHIVPVVAKTMPPVAPPDPILFPPVANMPGPDRHPALPDACPDNGFFGDPPTRNQSTTGQGLDDAEVRRRRAAIARAITQAQSERPLSAANLKHWLDATGTPLVMPSQPFRDFASGVPSLLQSTVRRKFENGCKARLQRADHPQGTLLPAVSRPGAKGPVRFMQFRDGTRPLSAVEPPLAADLFTAVGSFNVHSVAWLQATLVRANEFDVAILRWCVQIYDVYDWNLDSQTPFPVTDEQLKTLPLPREAIGRIVRLGGLNMVTIKDEYFRDLEVSGGGRAFLIRSETFDAPRSVMSNFRITI